MITVVGIPCMDKVNTVFAASLMSMRRPEGHEVHYKIKKGSLVFDARNEIAVDAITEKADRVLMIDSDMTFNADMFERLSARIDQGCEMVCGIFFKRVIPTAPVIYKQLEPPVRGEDGKPVKRVVTYTDYPKDKLFEVEGCGFGAVMMTTQLIKDIWDAYGPPFTPLDWAGEDMAFCYKARQLGRKIWCDSTIKVGHMGEMEFNEQTWLNQEKQDR